MPLLDYLCEYRGCSVPELQAILFGNLEERRAILSHLRNGVEVRTTHLRPAPRNFRVIAHGLSSQSVETLLALNGYLRVTVRQYYYVRHAIRLRHPYLPAIIMFGGGTHRSYYPLELLEVTVPTRAMCHPLSPTATATTTSSLTSVSQSTTTADIIGGGGGAGDTNTSSTTSSDSFVTADPFATGTASVVWGGASDTRKENETAINSATNNDDDDDDDLLLIDD